jgi:uncharacterized protein
MINYFKIEIRNLIKEIRTLDFKTTYVFISVSLILYISLTITNVSFYYKYIGKDFLYSRIYWLLGDGLLMTIGTVLSVKFILKKKLSDFGFTLGDKRFGFLSILIFYLVMLPVLWIVSASESFALTYPQGGPALRENFSLLILYEICIIIYMLGWEFMWRGYMLFGLKDKFGYYAIFVQMIPFFILHKGKPELELFGAILAGIILGIQALRSRSFIYAWILHSVIMISIDLISVMRYNLSFYRLI